MKLVKAHAFGNDFLLVRESDLAPGADRPSLTRDLCERHRGIGADGVIFYQTSAFVPATQDQSFSARMDLLNADGSYSEVSGNGVRCLAAWLGRQLEVQTGGSIDIETDAGVKRLEVLAVDGRRFTFRAAMGQPEQIQRRAIDVDGAAIDAITLRVGNPQCVVLGPLPDDGRFARLGPALEHHAAFPNRTNVEFAAVEGPDRVRIRIWERGVGPTESSGTGSCAAAVAASAFGGALRDVEVVSPGGAQRVVWTADGITLTGWAEILADGTFCAQL